jgi:hypothetical protein
LIENIASGTRTVPAGWDNVQRQYAEAGIYVEAVGRYGIMVDNEQDHEPGVVFLNWRSGVRSRHFLFEVGPGSLRSNYAFNLDVPQLTQRMCPPLHRRTWAPASGTFPYERYTYAWPYGATVTSKGLLLERCGQRRASVLERGWISHWQLGAGIVVWSTRTQTKAYLAASHRLLVWNLRGSVAHTAHTIYISVPAANPNRATPITWHVWEAQLPR